MTACPSTRPSIVSDYGGRMLSRAAVLCGMFPERRVNVDVLNPEMAGSDGFLTCKSLCAESETAIEPGMPK
jgi:hypothetical protein